MEGYWLYEWLDEFGVTKSEQLPQLLVLASKPVKRLFDLANDASWTRPGPPGQGRTAVVAGRGIDLSGELDCSHRDCQRRQVDALFSRVLHYFDEIVVAGPQAHTYARLADRADETTLHRLGEHLHVLLYLREIGAAEMLRFVEKRPACALHYLQHASEAGLQDVDDRAAAWTEELAAVGEIAAMDKHGDHYHYQFNHPVLEHSAWGTVSPDDAGRVPGLKDVAEAVTATYMAHLVSDVLTARDAGLPLALSVRLHEQALDRGVRQATEESVALELTFPVLEDLPVRDVIKLRQDEAEYFERFRQSLTEAIRQRIMLGVSTSDVADKVYLEVVEPALVDLDARLRKADRALGRKLIVSAGIGGLAASIGLLVGVPIVVGAGVGLTGTLQAAHKYLDEQGDIQLADMYFMWRLERQLPPTS